MFPVDILEQAFQGNPVAWYCIGGGIVLVALVSLMIFVWHKMPQLAKSQFINSTIGGNKPTVAQCYEDKTVRFFNPTVHRNTFFFSKGALYLTPKMWATAESELSNSEQSLLNGVHRMEGSQSALFFNYSIAAGMVNPELTAMIEHEETMQKLKPNAPVKVSKAKLLSVLQSLPDKEDIQIKPLFFSFPITDIRKLKSWLPKSLSKSNFMELDNKIRQDERGNKEGFNAQSLLVILMIVLIGLSAASLCKQFGLF
jgi:hypothetical protein